MALRGRKRKPGYRQPNGQRSRRLQAAERPEIIPPEVVSHRARAIGKKPSAELARDGAYATAYGRLWRAGVIDDRQYAAAERFEALWHEWSVMAGSPPRDPLSPGGAGHPFEPEREEWMRVKDIMRRLRLAIRPLTQSVLVWALLEGICVDGVIPPRLMVGERIDASRVPLLADGIRRGLDAVAGFFRIPRQEAAA